MLDPKFWKIAIFEQYLENNFELTNVFFNEDSHSSAREYVQRMRDAQTPDEPYTWIIHDPVLVDEMDVTDYNGEEYLDFIRKQQGE